MKSITQLFKNNKDLLEFDEVQQLIEYCKELEESVIETKQDQVFDKEIKLAELVREIYHDSNHQLQQDELAIRFKETERIDFKQCLINLKKYILKFSEENKFRL